MELTQDDFLNKYAKNCGQNKENILLPYEYELTCVSCGFNENKRKNDLSKIQRKKNKFYEPNKICRSKYIFHMYRFI